MKVTFYHRKPMRAHFSIESYFRDVRQYLPADVESVVATSRFVSVGLWGRVYNVLEAPFRQTDVNHITGDIHYVSYFLQKRRTILTIHDCGTIRRLRGLQREAFRQLWFAIPVRRVAVITVNSQVTKDDLLRFVACDPDRVRVIHVPVSSHFAPKPKDFNEQNPRVLMIGTAANKNLERTVEALSGLHCQLDIVGHLSEQQRQILVRCGADYVNSSRLSDAEIVAKYEAADVLMFASTFEGFGMPIVEANAVGRPVITANVYSMPEVAGDAACLVDPFNVESIREGFLRVIRDAEYRQQLLERGFRNAERFRPEQIARQFYRLYREVLSEGS